MGRTYEVLRGAVCTLGVTLFLTQAACGLEVTLGEQALPGPGSQRLGEKVKAGGYVLVSPGGKELPAQVDTDGQLWWWSDGSPAGTYTLQPAGAQDGAGVKVQQVSDGLIDVTIGGKPFTTFHFEKADPKPYLYPVIGPTGGAVTRDWPMKDNPEEKNAKRQDHPHHRSLWTAHGDVRLGDSSKKGTDYWASDEVKDIDGKRVVQHRSKSGYEKVTRIVRTVTGPVFGLIEADVDWTTAEGKRELIDTRTYRFFPGTGDARMIDVQVVFHFPEGNVTFADTKEGGILSLRIATSMDEVSKHGHMVNSEGQTGMKQCWGKPADWCDYVGPVDGKTVGIAVFDAPGNYGHPTTWHIRDYGLFTANPFGAREFTGDKSQDGSHTWKQGESAEFNYRIVIHKGDTKEAKIGELYRAYAQPPKASAGQ